VLGDGSLSQRHRLGEQWRSRRRGSLESDELSGCRPAWDVDDAAQQRSTPEFQHPGDDADAQQPRNSAAHDERANTPGHEAEQSKTRGPTSGQADDSSFAESKSQGRGGGGGWG
jgi:hypothetical protein